MHVGAAFAAPTSSSTLVAPKRASSPSALTTTPGGSATLSSNSATSPPRAVRISAGRRQFRPTNLKLQPCGSTTVALTVHVDCSKWGVPTKHSEQGTAAPTLDGCKVAYATLRADGCTVRPIVIAVAVLPPYCGAHHAGCGCSCCN